MVSAAAAAGNSATITITGVYLGVPPHAAFTTNPSPPSGDAQLTIAFDSSASTGTTPLTYSWAFGDGGTSALPNPSHTYTTAGTYYATLTVTNNAGSSTASTTITVNPPPVPLTAAFTATQTTCTSPWKVTFNDISTGNPTSRTWEYQKQGTTGWTVFGSGAKSPSLSFSTSASYNIRLTVYRGTESNSLVKSITPGTLTASFSASPTSGTVPLTVSFTDTSKGIPTSWKWDFGDKTSSADQNPVHTYTTAGTYTVKLTPSSSCGSCTASTKTITVNPVLPAPTVSSITPASANRGWTVSITNLKGTGFQTGATVKLTRTGYSDILGTGVTVVSSTKITCSFDLKDKTFGTWNVVVTNPDGKVGTLTNGFEITAPAPTVSSITPASGNRGWTTLISNLAGTGFQPGATVKLTRTGYSDILGTGVTVVSSTKITCSFDLIGATTGSWNVVVTNLDLQSGTLSNGFKVVSNAPTISGSFTPASGARGKTVTITSIPGTNFQPYATVVLTSASTPTTTITATVTSITSTKITATVVIPSGATTGSYTAKVTNTDGQSVTRASSFKVT